MAHYHLSVKNLKRSEDRTAVQFSAYMAGEKQKDERRNITYSHTTKEEVYFNEMMYSDRITDDLRSQSSFWNAVEGAEKAVNSRVARTFELALPHYLTIEQNIELAQEFANSLIEKDGLPACQIAVHKKEGNWHAHIMIPTRDYQNGEWQIKERKEYLKINGERVPLLDENGKQKVDSRNRKQWKRITVKPNQWNKREYIKEWRERYCDMQNTALAKHGHNVRVDHRSYKEQGISKIPQKHEGYMARKIEREGGISERCEYNREVAKLNAELEAINTEIKSLEQEKEALKTVHNKNIIYAVYNFLNNELNKINNDTVDVDMSDYKEEAYKLAQKSLKFNDTYDYKEAKRNFERIKKAYEENHKLYGQAYDYIKKNKKPDKGWFNGGKVKKWNDNNDIVEKEKRLIDEYHLAETSLESAKKWNDEKYLKALTEEANKYIFSEKKKRITTAINTLKKPIDAGIGFIKNTFGNIKYDNTEMSKQEQDLAVVSLYKMLTGKGEKQHSDLKEFVNILSSCLPSPKLMSSFKSALSVAMQDMNKNEQKRDAVNPALNPKQQNQQPRQR